MSRNVRITNFSDYLADQPEKTREALVELRNLILEAAPQAIEIMNYNIPAFALVEGGKRDQQIMIAGYKKHVGLYPHPTVIERFADDLSDYKFSKGSIQFPLDQPLPEELIKAMVKYRIELLGLK